MSDTPAQAAARLLSLAKDAPAGPYTLDAGDGPWASQAYVRAPSWGVVARTGLDATLPHWDGPQRAVAALFAACDPQTITMICQALAHQAQELDALRAELRWNDVRTDGFPPCDGTTVFDGINSNGHPGVFNVCSGGDCQMITAESYELVMGGLRYWRRRVGPAIEGEGNV
ncbi:hypothetical protein MW290_24760 [Aquincola tertiaricarbonis]|uniref:Uncharacterized protein n=1 Tax=Aquincola tertiaricarbonis TaxID=391953 RepID=A0ABY4S9Q4_AQUTE|nr:hypothetical protein [Aquincola tertiaricarbonis]URI08792.1 hypothetical protein MW290_24760 [Aquincola tertiaricarbonis]